MPDTFFASDHHFGHANMLKFVQDDGVTPCRPFSSVEEMDEHMIERHNLVVKPKDTVWFLGDVVINRRYLSQISRLNGRKRLILGNHDIFKNKDYYKAGFEDLHSFKKFDGFVCTHIPVHRESLRPSWGKNVHGHLHNNVVTKEIVWDGIPSKLPDLDYVSVCVEQIAYTPISIDELRKLFTSRTYF